MYIKYGKYWAYTMSRVYCLQNNVCSEALFIHTIVFVKPLPVIYHNRYRCQSGNPGPQDSGVVKQIFILVIGFGMDLPDLFHRPELHPTSAISGPIDIFYADLTLADFPR